MRTEPVRIIPYRALMLNPHHVEALVSERQRDLYATAATVHRGALARRPSRRAATAPSRLARLARWFARVAVPWRRPQPAVRSTGPAAPDVALATSPDDSPGTDPPTSDRDDRVDGLAA
jgi:hypothetical protein